MQKLSRSMSAPRFTWTLLLGSVIALAPALPGCSDARSPDPFLGTVDGAGFDPLFRGGNTSGCIMPRAGLGGDGGVTPVMWFYLGLLSPRQLDLANASDPRRPAPQAAYSISHCVPLGKTEFDVRTDSYLRTEQYPVLINASREPTSAASYFPWHVVIPAVVRPGKDGKVGCNDIKSQQSLEDRSGWDRDLKVFGKGEFDASKLADWPYGLALPEGEWTSGLDLQVSPPSWDQIRGGRVTFKDWPMVNVAAPIGRTPDIARSCPLPSTSMAKNYPRFPGDPDADFHFPSQAWWRGLLSGYLDGGDLPIQTDPLRCPALVPTTRSCSMSMPCDTAKGETCSGGRCLSPVPVCPVINNVYIPVTDVQFPAGATASAAINTALSGSSPVLSTFAATPKQPGYSPVCRVNIYDPSRLSCGRACSAAQIVEEDRQRRESMMPPAIDAARSGAFIHCLFLMEAKKS